MAYAALAGTRARPAGSPECWRCGVEIGRRSSSHLIEGAPCRDCRDSLAAEGDATVWDMRKIRAAAATS